MPRCELPSSMTGEVKPIQGLQMAQASEAADGVGDSDGGAFTNTLGACWLRTYDPGPYRIVSRDSDAKPPWDRMLKGDMIGAMVGLRQISLTNGDDYDFDVRCEECGKRIKWTVKLSEMPVKRLPRSAFENIAEGRPFETTFKGKRVTYKLQTLEQEKPIAALLRRMKRKKTTPIDVITSQLVHVDGCDSIEKRWTWVAEMSIGELSDFSFTLAENDCGFETGIEVRCHQADCGWEQPVDIPLASRRFFSPKKKRLTVAGAPSWDFSDGGAPSSEDSPANGGGASAPTSFGRSTAGADTEA